MGYCIDQRDRDFYIRQGDKEAAFRALRALFSTPDREHFAWIHSADVLGTETLEAAMQKCRWHLYTDEGLNVIDIEFTGEKSGDDYEIFEAIAPFVRKDSYIEMQGEDGAIWRWVFTGTFCKEVDAKIVFDY